ncbi:putative GTPase activating protein (Evi5) [Tuber indicum]|nr:putative GTPase activating protein (Evi5) [Tuber indicum]
MEPYVGSHVDSIEENENTPVSKTTMSMVTVRLSDTTLGSLPSPTPTLKLVDDNAEELPLNNGEEEPMYSLEPIESPSPDEMAASRRYSTESISSQSAVDWEGLERTEGESIKDETSEEGTAFLLARLEQENKRLEKDPKALHIHPERPPSLAQLKRMMDKPDPETLRYSMLPAPPPLTDLEFYAALVADYNRAASKLPHLLSKKIRGGIPPPLRGVVWIAMSGARDSSLEGLYDQLLGETSPYEHLIGKDIGRTGLEMFKQEGGEGQRMLGRVLRAFSIYDAQIGYCQGLGFLVGPLLMHMGEKEAFCVLVRLMEHYDLRSCFLPNMYGLQLRMYQFTQLLAIHLPELSAHLNRLGIQPTYASQWFLSFFAVSCPLPMLFRVYDVIFAEGAPETIMRVALSLMRRNEKRLLATSEFEDVMQMLLARGLWDTYNFNANDLVQDFVGLTGIVTSQGLADLEKRFKEEHPDDNGIKAIPAKTPGSDLQAAASRFLGRMWGGGSSPGPVSLSPASGQSRPASILMRRTPSKQSLSTVSSFDASDTGSGTTDATTLSRCSSVAADDRRISTRSISSTRRQNKDGELHGQIEDLLMALSALQREHAAKVDELQTVKAQREEERILAKRLVELLANGPPDGDEPEGVDGIAEISDLCDQISENLTRAESETVITPKPSTAQLEEELQRAREQIHREQLKSRDLSNKLAEQDADVVRLRSQLLDARSKWQESQREKQQLQKTINELKHPLGSPELKDREGEPQKGGLRELRLGRSNSTRGQPTPTFNKRSSSLGMQSILAQDNNAPATADALLVELVASKTAEAVAKQEAEEARAKLEALRKVLGGGTSSSASSFRDPPLSPGLDRTASGSSFSSYLSVGSPASATPSSTTSSGGGFWGGWGKKSTAVDSR